VDLARYTALFLSDSRDHLQRCNELLLAWERAPGDTTPVAPLFRSFHSIKGSAASLGFEPITELAHAAEQLLDAIREGRVHPTAELLDTLFLAVDGLAAAVEAVARADEPAPDPGLPARLREFVAARVTAEQALPAGERRTRPRAGGPAPATAPPSTSGLGAARQVRVNLERLDALLQGVRELVVARSRLAAIADRDIGSELEQVSGRIAALVATLQRNVLRARMAPVDEVFNRFPRMIRDLARGLGKEIRLELQGTDIELDRSVLDGLAEPLTHLLRNAADHGLETPAERVAGGKPREGLIRLRAEQDREGVIVTLADDGRGIDRAGVLRRAIELGLLPLGAPLPDAAGLLRLLSQPGFTTRSEVTELSGRGVGIDAVVARVRALGGRMELKSTVGRGTVFLVHLPVTRSIVRALVVEAGGQRYAIPFGALAEAVVHDASASEVSLRGQPLATVDLRALLGVARGAPRRPAIVLDLGDRRTALVVDGLLGQHDVVVEPLAAPVGLPAWVGGGTILSDGVPALLLDPAALF
jgi:two-component system chemotaxis sensor kinase CheA